MTRFDRSREIIERIVVEGTLVLLTPTSIGNGDADGMTDMPLLTDALDGSALLTGTSIAGALRNYLREHEEGYAIREDQESSCRKLFGFIEDKEGDQSCLIVDDSIGEKPTTELRDGVRIDGKTRTAFIDDKGKGSKFDLELLEAGTSFTLRFELLISDAKTINKDGNEAPMFPPRDELVKALATALQGFERDEIHLGARKRRGYGECKVSKWRVKPFDLVAKDTRGLTEWLRDGAKPLADLGIADQDSIATALGVSPTIDRRELFEMTASFGLDGSMLIRSGSKLPNVNEKGQPDTVHLRSRHKDRGIVPVVSGTSLAGVLRHRAVRICNTLKDGSGERFVERIFGVDMEELKKRNRDNGAKDQPFASRLEVKETFIQNTNDLVHTRVKIDRFTGGAFEGALFDAAPVFSSGEKEAVNLRLRLRTVRLKKDNGQIETDEETRGRTDAEIGLLLLLLKDLWTSDLAIGGESSIGRGRLKGISANLHNRNNDNGSWRINLKETDKMEAKLVDGSLPDSDTKTKFLNDLVGKLRVELEKDDANN